MGIRTDQFIGLSGKAEKFLEENAVKDCFKTYKNDELISTTFRPKEMDGNYKWTGMFGDETLLPSFQLEDGRVVHEKIQAESWSSGPVIFTYLVIDDKKPLTKTRWSKKNMGKYLF